MGGLFAMKVGGGGSLFWLDKREPRNLGAVGVS